MKQTEIYFETFAQAVDAAGARAHAERAVLSKPSDLWNICQEPLYYTQTRTVDCKLDTYKGKPTKKYFHATIYRMDCGRYELTTYVL